jgi:arsenate reductase (thioredoxin)
LVEEKVLLTSYLRLVHLPVNNTCINLFIKKMNVLALCTGNSCRSQMAEGFLRKYLNESFSVYSAGIEKHGLNPNTVRVMKEVGIDISRQSSKTIEELPDSDFDFVITVCDNALENCPYYPAKTKMIHQSFTDPSNFEGSLEEINESYRICRDVIGLFCKEFAQKYNVL